MMTNEQLLEAAETNYLNGTALSAEQISLLETLLRSESSRIRSIACGALLRDHGSNVQQKSEARKTLNVLCVKTENTDISGMTELSITLLVLPFSEICTQDVKEFIYRLFQSEYFTHRANAVLLLGRLARHGDKRALPFLKSAMKDTNAIVQANADKAIQELGLSI